MNKLLLILSLLAAPLYAETQLGHDTAHFALSYTITTAVYGISKQLNPSFSKLDKVVAGIFASLVLGFAKEAYDSTVTQSPLDLKDLAINAAGTATGVGAIYVFDF